MRRTTVRIDDQLLADAKAFAAQHGRSLNSVVEDALRQMLNRTKEGSERPRVELPAFTGEVGLQPGADLTPAYLRELLLEEDVSHYLEVEHREAARRQRADKRLPSGGGEV